MSDFLKGNFKIKNEVLEKESLSKNENKLKQELRKAALNSIGGSMVYVERTDFTWNGEEDIEKKSNE
jgi:hypothetical protein